MAGKLVAHSQFAAGSMPASTHPRPSINCYRLTCRMNTARHGAMCNNGSHTFRAGRTDICASGHIKQSMTGRELAHPSRRHAPCSESCQESLRVLIGSFVMSLEEARAADRVLPSPQCEPTASQHLTCELSWRSGDSPLPLARGVRRRPSEETPASLVEVARITNSHQLFRRLLGGVQRRDPPLPDRASWVVGGAGDEPPTRANDQTGDRCGCPMHLVQHACPFCAST
jgi:hypothetical protein